MSVGNVNDSAEVVNKYELNNTTVSINDNENIEAKKFLLNEKKFEQLRKVQREVFNKTEVSPSIRKMVNMIITEEEIDNLREKLIVKFTEETGK